MTIQLQSTSNVAVSTCALLYGAAKSGKTRTIPTCESPVICSTDKGLSSIREHNIPFVDCTTWSQVQEFATWAVSSKEATQFSTIVIDDLSEAAEILLAEVKPRHKSNIPAYGEFADTLMAFVRKIREVPRNILLICKQEKVRDETTGGLLYGPKLPGQLSQQNMPYLVGEIWHMEQWTDPSTQIVHDVIRTKRTNSVDAGSRSGRLAEIEFANMANIFAKVRS